MITGIDHTIIGVKDLAGATHTWSRLGFTLCPRGRHIGWGTANYCIMFPDNYIELLGIIDSGQFTNNLDTKLDTIGDGLHGVAFAADAFADPHEALPDLTHPTKPLKRLLDLPEGTVVPEFRTTHFKDGATPGLSAFVVQHLTPALMRQPDWMQHANGAVDLEGVTVVHEDPAACALAYRSLFGDGAIRISRDRIDVSIGRHTLRILGRERFATRYPGVQVPTDLPAPMVQTINVRSLNETSRYLAATGIGTVPVMGERLVIAPDQASGAVLEFAEA